MNASSKAAVASRWLPICLVVLSALCLPLLAAAESSASPLWQDVDEALVASSSERDITPHAYRTVSLDDAALRDLLATASLEHSTDLTQLPESGETLLSLPLPDGGFARFRIVESPIMAPGLAAKFPDIKTYRGQGVDDPAASVRFDRTPAGFHAMIRSSDGSVYIDPYGRDLDGHYISYWARDASSAGRVFTCGVEEHLDTTEMVASYRAQVEQTEGAIARSGATLRTYRLAVAATGEYTAFHGGTVAQGQAAIVTAMNRVNGIYEQEVAIRMVLVANNNLLVYTNPATDPYTNGSGSTMLGENQTNINAVIGSANYDIGHVFSTGGGGVATLGVPCTGGKARGVTGQGSPIGDPFWVDFVAHEMGHQWAGTHTFNGDAGNCAGGNRTAATAYEPGSGSTIQAYAGICGAQNLQSNSDPYFHGISLDQIIAYSTVGNGNGCAVQTATGNNPPTVDAGAAYSIPLDTPFELCGSGVDPDLDPLTFGWEEFDLGPAGAPDAPVGNAPIFRSWNPTVSPCRTFPRISDIAAGTSVIGELLPTYARTMNFRLTARDNRSGGGGIGDDATTVTAVDTGAPFRVTAPNTATSFGEGAMATVMWDVADTDQAPINCAAVDIFFSDDSGLTFPTVLATGVANSGSSTVTMPSATSMSARIQVRCSTNIFFDMSDVDFGIGVPAVVISAPLDGSTFTVGDGVTFVASANDPEDGDISGSLTWTSSIDGSLGGGASITVGDLSIGTHTITASVTDSDTNTTSASIMVMIEPACAKVLYEAGYETDSDGWVDGASSCTTGTFIRGTPDEVIDGIVTQVGGAATGTFAWFTANNGGGVGTDDVDGGTCETLSPSVASVEGGPVAVFMDYFHGQRDGGDDAADGFSIELIDGDTDAVLATLVTIGDETTAAVWTSVSAQVDSAPTNVRLRVRATDGSGGGDLIEGGIDNVRICRGLADALFNDGFETGSTSEWSATID